jgi:hypothetical protein
MPPAQPRYLLVTQTIVEADSPHLNVLIKKMLSSKFHRVNNTDHSKNNNSHSSLLWTGHLHNINTKDNNGNIFSFTISLFYICSPPPALPRGESVIDVPMVGRRTDGS